MNFSPTSLAIQNPYPGLRPFEAREFESFFGRDRQIDELLARLRDHRFVAVVGLSGSGKSSLVRAGLIHRLQVGHLTSAGSQWRTALFRPGSQPIEALAAALDEALGNLPDRAKGLRKSTQELVRSTDAGRSAGENLLVVVDQFEEIFRFQHDKRLSDRDAAHFVELLLAAEQDLSPDYRVYVVLTMRTDYLGDCAQFEGLPETLNRSQYLVPRLTREQTREAIEGPAALADTEMASDLLQTLLVESTEGRDTLPLLQHGLMRLWEEREPSPTAGWRITLARYQSLGGMAKALNDDANDVLAKLPQRHQHLAKRIFQELTERGEGRDQRRPMRLSQLAERTGAILPDVTTVVEYFMGVSFLTSPNRGRNQDWEVDISHESLIRQWQTLADWAQEQSQDRDDYLYFASRVERGGELLTGRDLALAVKWRERNHRSDWSERYGGDAAAILALIERSRKRLIINRVFWWSIAASALLVSATVALSRYRQYELVKYEEYKQHLSAIAREGAEKAQQQGMREGLEKGQDAARANAQGLTEAILGDFEEAQKMFKLAGDTNATLPIETLDRAITDGQHRNDPALTNLRIARQRYLASQSLVAVAANGAILRSENGGTIWQAQDLGTGIDLWSVTFATPHLGWAAGEKGTILHTEDGGRSWLRQTSGTSVDLSGAVVFLDERLGWATGIGGTVLHTEDGGRNWRNQNSGTDAYLGGLSFVNPQSGWSAGSRGTILHTLDGGNSWQKQSSPTNEVLRSITFVTLQLGWAVGYSGTILHTEDGGQNWQIQTSNTDAWLYGITFVSQQSGWVVGQHGTILHTDDGGRHWLAQSSSTNSDLHAVSFLTSRSGWAAGNQGTILFTEDGGNAWRRQHSDSGDSLNSMTFVGQR